MGAMIDEYWLSVFSSNLRNGIGSHFGHVVGYATAEQMGRFQGERPTDTRDRYSWEPATRIARLVTPQDSKLAQRLRATSWARIVRDESNYAYWTAAEGTVDVSAPSLEPGDETDQEIRAGTDYFRSEKTEMWQELARLGHLNVHNLVVVRLHVTRLYGAFRPEDELDEWVEPMYW
ncbi:MULTISPECIES: hypothetical protein [unclassified Streptomyces]|uniref:hypothetical protein n=1 Tax=unclassified Streptomyces TaxID=2593676 RepID=UPI0016566B48|nr:hypothetical protein [Streptomyces sp. CB02980]MCB8903931.1 hypothetical protein [Streptomyces sp. CB02980]